MVDLESLNPQQRAAVTHQSGPLLVLAGAGSGKTRVITYRIAWLVAERGVEPASILAVTFTNKAAGEMLSRVERLVPRAASRPWIGTFHSVALRMLRRWADRLGYTKSFTVYDTADQMTLVKRAIREIGLDETAFPPRSMLSNISRAKNQLIGPERYERENTDFFGSRVAKVYRLYQSRLREYDAMDFDDLIGNLVRLLDENEDVRNEIHSRFAHILIDEYQDTNHAQYVLIRRLTGERTDVVAVGDEDQSIYGFRGADIENILNFERDFPGATIVKLEQNYRSTGNILGAATGVVSRNVKRKGKTLFTSSGAGDPIRVVSCESEREEAKFVVNRILELRARLPLAEMAVLFRMNAQSRPFEEELLAVNLPYSVVGGVKFYERAEIKDTLAYLRLAVRDDTPSIERVINTPARGIGATTFKALEEHAAAEGVPLWRVIEGSLTFLPERARKAVREFRETIVDLRRAATTEPLPAVLDFAMLRSGYRKMLLASRDPQDETRLQNLEELVNSAREFHEANFEAGVAEYLDSVSLISDVDQYQQERGVTLMTLHAAKGLEFRVVFLAGMEEGILPHSQSKDEVEEERRLCYVGMTRAREQLYCLWCFQRRIHGQFREQSPSPFLAEIPEEVTEEVRMHTRFAPRREWDETSRPRTSATRPDARNVFSFFGSGGRPGAGGGGGAGAVQFNPAAIRTASRPAADRASGEFRRGGRVRHDEFGDGVILRMEGSGENAKLTVYFERAGTKKFVAKYAKLRR
ncbi:MAG: ATP-dependent helicase, partial [Thermoanaerobaculia bacterium]